MASANSQPVSSSTGGKPIDPDQIIAVSQPGPSLQGILDTIGVSLTIFDPDGRCIYANSCAADICSLPVEAMRGRTIGELFPALQAADIDSRYPKKIASGHMQLLQSYGSSSERRFEHRLYPASNGLTVLSTDITNDTQVQQLPHSSNQHLSTVLESISDAFYALDGDWRFTYVNQRCQEVMGYRAQELLGRSLFEVFPTIRDSEFQHQFEHALRQRSAVHFECLAPSGQWFETHAYPSTDGLSIYFRDVTERKRAEEELARTRLLFERMADATPDILYLYDLVQKRSTYNNPQLERTLGHSAACFLEEGFASKLLHPDDRPAGAERSRQFASLRDGDILELEFRMRHARGDYRWLRTRNVVFARAADGRITQILGVAEDVTEERRAAEALRASEDRFRTLSETLPQLLWACDHSGRCNYLSRQWVEYTGVAECDHHGFGWQNAVHPEDHDRIDRVWQAAINDQGIYDVEFRLRRHDGQYRWFKTRGVPLRDEGGHILAWFGSCTDMDDLKRAEEALHEADRCKDEFLAMLAHELRNPLAPIRNAVHILRSVQTSDPVLQQHCGMIDRQVQQLSHLLDDLLDVSRITRGKIQLRRESVDLHAILAQAVETSRAWIDAKSLRSVELGLWNYMLHLGCRSYPGWKRPGQ